jgi:putative addiction module component (TIGR02574 family)
MVKIEEILQLPKQEQVAIMHAIQDNLDSFEDDWLLSDEHIAFVKQRINNIETSNQPAYTWQQVKEDLKNRWNTK